MADSVVSFVLQNLSQVLAREANLLCGVEDRIRSLYSELEIINALLQASEGKKGKKKIEQVVINQIKDVAHQAEDVIDTFVANMAMHKRRTKLGRMLHGVDHAKLLHDVAEKIDSINATINDIRDNKIKYDSFRQEGESTSTREDEDRMELLHKRRRNVEEDDVVGFVCDSKVVIERLMGKDSRSNVVSIVGMGGLGKTTLARKVYNSDEVEEYFSCRAWVYVSNDCRVKELWLGLLKCLMPNSEYECRSKKKGKKHKGVEKPRDLSSLSEDELKQMVRDCLKGKRYLLVLDDLWKTQDWDEVQDAFPNDNIGSKILITSRSKEVASHASRDPPYCLQLLSDEESWELFSKRAFRGEKCPSGLESLGKQIVKSCRGLPLSIIVLAGLLANKEKSHREWSKVVGHVNSYLTQEETRVKDIVLKLSYDNLPGRLKPCFLYLGIFPEDFEISVTPLLQQWVAEGFIQQIGDRYPEDVAEDYLYELIDRSLVQAAWVDNTSGNVKSCRIHDLLRDLCISESKEDKVFEVYTDNNILVRTKPRRLSVHCRWPHYVSLTINDHSYVRSLFYSGPKCSFTPSQCKWIIKCFKLVRVLDLGSCQGEKILSNLGMFIHLRYLRIFCRYLNIISTSICTLQNLQTLSIAGDPDYDRMLFPTGLWKLKQLRHIYTNAPIFLRGHHHSKSEDEVMLNLQTILSIALDRQTAYLFEKGRLPKLRTLMVVFSSDCKGKLRKFVKHFQGPTLSEDNQMEWNIGCRPHELLQSLRQLTHLNKLSIFNALDLPTYDVTFPPNITELTLYDISCMNDDGMNALGNLTKLRILTLDGAPGPFDSFELNCAAGGFPQLQGFQMTALRVHSWKLANGAMPCLQSLGINYCRRLHSLPNELWSLTTLRRVEVQEPSEELSFTLRNLKMKDGCELII